MEWSDGDSRIQIHQDRSGRLWDVVWMAITAIHLAEGGGDRLNFQLYRIPWDGESMEAQLTTLKLIVGPGDQGEPVVTILLADED